MLCGACKQKQTLSNEVHYKKYRSGIDGSRGVIFYFKLTQDIPSDSLQSVFVNDFFVPYTTRFKGDTLLIEANAFQPAPEKGYDPERGHRTGYPQDVVLNAPSFEGYIVFLKEGKQDSIHFTKFESLNTINQESEK
jgi:hypothetical protein